MDSDALRRALTLASAFKEGDRAVGGGSDPAVRHEARQALLACTVGDIHRTTLVDDGVSEALARSRDRSDHKNRSHFLAATIDVCERSRN